MAVPANQYHVEVGVIVAEVGVGTFRCRLTVGGLVLNKARNLPEIFCRALRLHVFEVFEFGRVADSGNVDRSGGALTNRGHKRREQQGNDTRRRQTPSPKHTDSQHQATCPCTPNLPQLGFGRWAVAKVSHLPTLLPQPCERGIAGKRRERPLPKSPQTGAILLPRNLKTQPWLGQSIGKTQKTNSDSAPKRAAFRESNPAAATSIRA